MPNDLAAAIIAVQTELGTDPAGSSTSVKTRLAAEHNDNGTHSSITATNLTLTGELIQKIGSDVASASDLNITGVGNFFDVTGTTGIATMQSKGVGSCVTLQFDGICVLTHDATNFDLGSNAANITTAAGDVFTFYEYASADWRLISRSPVTTAETFTAGMIMAWSGAISAIPSGWVICDGTNSTPDLTGKFIIHADADAAGTYNVGDTAAASANVGATAISEAQMPAHTHTTPTGASANSAENGGGVAVNQAASVTGSTGSGATHTHTNPLPPYYALAYIMKS